MKIGIISINAHTKVLNFASPLHSYAFQKFLKDHGIESTIIDYKPIYYRKFDARHPLHFYEAHPRRKPEVQERLIKKWTELFDEREYRFDRFEEFIQKYYHKTEKCYTARKLDKKDPGFDCYICVTDVIWKASKRGFDRGFFLACKQMEGKKKIAYAASRGPGEYTAEQAKEFFDYISDIDYISVREKSLQQYIQANSDLPVTHVLDPVFLQEKEFYHNLAIQPEKKGYVLIYVVMERAKDLIKTAVRFAELHNLEVIELGENLEDANIPAGTHHEVLYGLGVEEWLGYMQNASYIFTNSFHACCFSIILGKQFFVGNRAGDKIDSVLEMFQLSDRRIIGVAPKKAAQMPDIAFKQVEALRQEYVQFSKDFILNAIHDMEQKPHENHHDLVHKKIYNGDTVPFTQLTQTVKNFQKKVQYAIKKYLTH